MQKNKNKKIQTTTTKKKTKYVFIQKLIICHSVLLQLPTMAFNIIEIKKQKLCQISRRYH